MQLSTYKALKDTIKNILKRSHQIHVLGMRGTSGYLDLKYKGDHVSIRIQLVNSAVHIYLFFNSYGGYIQVSYFGPLALNQFYKEIIGDWRQLQPELRRTLR